MSAQPKHCFLHYLVPLLWILVLGVFSGCAAPHEKTVTMPNGEEWPAVLNFAYVPSSEDPEGRMTIYKELEAYLERMLGIDVRLVRTASYGPTIEAMRARKIDVTGGGPFAYLIAHSKAGAEVIIARGTKEHGPGMYHSMIATSPKTGIRSLEDLKARGKNAIFAFTDPASASGHLVPRGFLETIGMQPESTFREVVFTQSHLNVMMTTVAAKVDAGAMSASTYERFLESGRIKEDEIVVLWKSDPIPNSPIFARRDLPAGLRRAIQDAYIRMEEEAPSLLESFREIARRPDMIYVEADDSMFDGLRQIARNLETMKLID